MRTLIFSYLNRPKKNLSFVSFYFRWGRGGGVGGREKIAGVFVFVLFFFVFCNRVVPRIN